MIIPFNELKEYRKKWSGKLVATNGVFDILHHGHLKSLAKSKEIGDILLVGINSDAAVKSLKGFSRPINNEIHRAIFLDSLKMVDYVCIFDNINASDFLEMASPDIYTKSGNYTISSLDRKEYSTLNKVGAEIKILPIVEDTSTSKIINLLKNGW